MNPGTITAAMLKLNEERNGLMQLLVDIAAARANGVHLASDAEDYASNAILRFGTTKGGDTDARSSKSKS